MALKLRKNHSPAPPPDCPLMACMAFIGGAWTPNILWYLSAGPRRFSELKADIPGVSPKMLTTRLRELERAGIADRTVMPTSPPSVEYALTELGQELVPAIQAIVDVGHKLKKLKQRNALNRSRRAPKIGAADAQRKMRAVRTALRSAPGR